jgi:hypothetical protein
MIGNSRRPRPMNFRFAAIAFALVLSGPGIVDAAAAPGARQEPVQFARGTTSATLKGQLIGDQMVDYVVRAAAGQTLSVKLTKSNPQNYFNVMPPGSTGSAMYVGDTGEDYSGVLPTDGSYLVRVYLMRPAARRGERSNYTATISVTGKPLVPIAASTDALVPGTSYHASAKVRCVPAFESAPRDCDAFVIRRGFDGTATVDIPGTAENRSILFVKGKPVASNARATEPLSSQRKGDTTVVKLGDSESYEVPDALIFGG